MRVGVNRTILQRKSSSNLKSLKYVLLNNFRYTVGSLRKFCIKYPLPPFHCFHRCNFPNLISVTVHPGLIKIRNYSPFGCRGFSLCTRAAPSCRRGQLCWTGSMRCRSKAQFPALATPGGSRCETCGTSPPVHLKNKMKWRQC